MNSRQRRVLALSGWLVCWCVAGCDSDEGEKGVGETNQKTNSADDDAADDSTAADDTDAQPTPPGSTPSGGEPEPAESEPEDTEPGSNLEPEPDADEPEPTEPEPTTMLDPGSEPVPTEPEPTTMLDPGLEPEPTEPEPTVIEPEPIPEPETFEGPLAGNPEGDCAIPSGAGFEDTSSPDRVVGNGTPASCTADAFIDAVAQGGVITFDCGPDPVTLTLNRPAKVVNDTGPRIVIDGGGLVTLSGGGQSRILYMNTCDEQQVWTTSHCQDQDHPQLTVQNLTFIDANSKSEEEYDGGGAIWVRGGRFKVVNSRFFNNVCADTGPDVGGAGIRVFSQYQGLPVYVVNSTFGGEPGLGNVCSNGGGISSIGVSWTIINSLFSYNRAIGNGGNPAQSGTPGGGSGGAIYNDGNQMTLSLCGTRIEHNEVNAYGSAIFFVSNNHTGDIQIRDSVITNNVGGSWYATYPQISNHDDTPIDVVNSTIE